MGHSEFIIEPGKQDIVMKREFDAPREVVFRAYTDPDLIPNWWGPRSVETIVDRMEVKTGGVWRYYHRDPNGDTYGFWGVYHEVAAPHRLVSTFEFEGAPGSVVLDVATFDEVDGRTMLVTRSVCESVEVRDEAVKSGMESGAKETFDRLAELVERR
jgi:uncharacterized protein YndB with AHSA1/START domain